MIKIWTLNDQEIYKDEGGEIDLNCRVEMEKEMHDIMVNFPDADDATEVIQHFNSKDGLYPVWISGYSDQIEEL